MRYLVAVPLLLAACAPLVPPPSATAPAVATSAPASVAPPVARPPASARTVEQFDTTTEEDRAAAVATPVAATSAALGSTIATLGPPADPGIWIKTPLVTSTVMGRVENPANGKTISLELRPSGGAAGSGSQLSLAAMRLLEIPLTALAEVEVFGG